MTKIDPECRKTMDRLVKSALSSAKSAPPSGVADHLRNCERCRKYAEGLNAAPLLFQRASLYTPALKRRTLTAVAESRRSGDLRLAILVSVPVAFSLLLSFCVQVYLVYLALSRTLSSSPISWPLSIAVVTSFGAAAGFVCLAMLARKSAQQNKLQEVFGD